MLNSGGRKTVHLLGEIVVTGPKSLIAGNWKMHRGGAHGVALAKAVLAAASKETLACDLLLCPPAVVLAAVSHVVDGTDIATGGQDCHAENTGAHTGDISASMLAGAGATYVIVGHSERRTDHRETDADVRAKAEAAQKIGMTAIICIGETGAERDSGQTLAVLSRQIAGSVPAGATAAHTVIAYEPVWAIGTGRTPTVAEVAEAHAHIRKELGGKVDDPDSVRILYGGSVKADNARELLAVANVNGALVGGASLDAASFVAIARTAP
ncbi:MAG: triose-phosphate isomerase [Alphaproteobacteria bacterium]|jgi:triosephosphate isomerase|nr:triose-phosphate isomerase [Alphaproteobacteria bacterium]